MKRDKHILSEIKIKTKIQPKLNTMKKCISLLCIVLFMSCNDAEHSKNIIGDWECASWINVATGEDNCNNNVTFNFNDDQTYTSKIQSSNVEGNYKITNGLLYCTPTGKMEIAVEINKLTSDTLAFTMSRSGNKEVMTLVKK